MSKHPIQHYVSKMFIKRFMNGRHRLYILDVDSSTIQHGTLKESFGVGELWNDDIERKLSNIETKIGKILKYYDKIQIEKKAEHKCTVWVIGDSKQRDSVFKMALLEPKLLADLKDGKRFKKNILDVLDNDYSSNVDSVFYIKLYQEYCNGKFLITDYLGQNYINRSDILDSSSNNTIEDVISGNSNAFTAPISHYFITGEYELFFVGKEENMYKFLESLRKQTLIISDENGKEYEYKKVDIDNFELTVFNLNEIKSQESQCKVGCYDKEYLNLIKDRLPIIVSEKIIFRKTSMIKK